MEKTRAELMFNAMEDWDALKHLYLVQTDHAHNEEVDTQAYAWYQTSNSITLEDIMSDLIDVYKGRDNEDYLCTEESANCVMCYLGGDYNKYSLYDFAEEIYTKFMEYKE